MNIDMQIDSKEKWVSVKACPLCECKTSNKIGPLLEDSYSFGDEKITFKEKGISIYECQQCGLFYKNIIPSPKYLSKVFESQAGNVWQSNYNYLDELGYISKLTKNKDRFDILDIGPSNGGLLKVFSDNLGRQSALDIVEHPGLRKHLNGEFINCLLDDDNVRWSKNPYDIVTIYDVFEHLYDPKIALQNIHNFLGSGGYVIIETGDANSYWPNVFGLNNWWYCGLFEHHIFWNKESIKYASNQFGFNVVSMQHVRHKNSRNMKIFRKVNRSILGVLLWKFSPGIFIKLKKYLNKSIVQARDLFTKDHLLIVLQKK